MTYREMIEVLTILAKYAPNELDSYCAIQPEHDELHTDLDIYETSTEDAVRLKELGCSDNAENWWVIYT